MANEDSQTSSITSTTLDSWATTPSTWRQNSDIEFRVRRRGQPTRRLRLPGARYTLGSGTGCSIPLEDASLRPLHAVLIRDEERILVRAYSVPLQINNKRVAEGLLSTGDRLRLGAYEFELLETSLDLADSISHTISQGVVGEEEHGEAQKDDWSRSFHEEAKQWRALKQDTQRREEWCQARERELQEQDASLTQKMEALHNREEALQTQESAAAEVHDEFLHHYQELLRHRDELQLQQEELATGREQLRLQQERLEGRDRLHRQQIDKLIGEQEELKNAGALTQQKLADSESQLVVSRQQAEAATSAVAQMREKFTSLSEQLVRLSQHQASLQQLEAQRTLEHRQRTDELELARDEALAQCEYVSAQRDNIATQRDEIAAQRDDLVIQRNELVAERDDIAIERDDIAIERDDIAMQRDDIAIERDQIAACCQELELVQEQLRMEIGELQRDIARTRADADTLDQDCWEARHMISGLEDTLRDQDDRHETDRQSWTHEVDALRKNIDELSLDLDSAQTHLSQLREDNTRLSDQLIGATAERDEARAEREAAIEQRQAAQQACDIAKMDCESARRELDNARLDVKLARQERDEAAALRDEIAAQRDEIAAQQNEIAAQRDEQTLSHEAIAQQRDELVSEQAAWAEQKSHADRRYQEARAHLADAREKCERAVRARDEAEAARLAAEEELAIATADLKAMQAERDHAIALQEDLRRQRDDAIQDAQDTRELFDRSNRDHDDTLELIERLEQKTREVMGTFVPDLTPAGSPRLSLLDHGVDAAAAIDVESCRSMTLAASEPSVVNEPFDAADVWPTYSTKELEPDETPAAVTPTEAVAPAEAATPDAVATAAEVATPAVCVEPACSVDCDDAAETQAADFYPVDECTNKDLSEAVPAMDRELHGPDPQIAEPDQEPTGPPSLSIVTKDSVAKDSVAKDVVAKDVVASDAPVAEDDSIEAYMNRLLQRVQGRITDAVPRGAQSEQEDQEEPEQLSIAAQSVIKVGEVSMKPVLHDDSPETPAEPVKEDKGPSAARKPTISPARNTAPRSQKTTSQATLKYAQMGAALLCGAAAVVLVALPMLKMVAAIAAVLIAAICAKEAIALKTEVIRPSNSKREVSKTHPVATKAAA